jgi:Matrixin
LRLYILAAISLFFLFLLAILLFDTDLAFAKKEGDSQSNNIIELCCAWGDSLDDGILTFSIENGASDLAKIVKLAFNDWEKSFDGEIEFEYVKEDSDSDIEIEFKKGKGKKVGESVIYFDNYEFINFVEIEISKKSYDVTLGLRTLEHIVKHEIGHALGLGHANFKDNLMSPNIDEIITEISACEVDSVKYANYWKFIDNDDSPNYNSEDYSFKCKKK